jgi:transcriptional regulator with XRE-family HTH domain
VSRSAISRIECGRLDSITLGNLRRISEALGADLDVRLRWNGEGLDRLLDQAHATLVEVVVQRLTAAGWVAEVEVSFAIGGERGAIDVLAHHRRHGVVLVVEVKSVVPDSQATIHGLDRKSRLASQIAVGRGWEYRHVARLLVIGDSSTSRRRIAQLSATYGVAFPTVGRRVLSRLGEPFAPISGLLFLPFARPANARTATTGIQRVRLPNGSRASTKRAPGEQTHVRGRDA